MVSLLTESDLIIVLAGGASVALMAEEQIPDSLPNLPFAGLLGLWTHGDYCADWLVRLDDWRLGLVYTLPDLVACLISHVRREDA
jgi:hypothetical protein